MSQAKTMSLSERAGFAVLALCVLLVTVAVTATPRADAQVDYTCTTTISSGQTVLEFSGADIGRTANLRDADGWISTVTGETQYRLPVTPGETYHVIVRPLNTRVDCTALATTSFTCSALTVGRSDTRLVFGGDIGASANLRNGDGWVQTVTGQASVRVPGRQDYFVALNTAAVRVPCEPVDYQCSYAQSGANAQVSFEGELAESTRASLRTTTSYVANVTGLESIEVPSTDNGFRVWFPGLSGYVGCTESDSPRPEPTPEPEPEPEPQRPVTEYSCVVVSSGGDAHITFDGVRANNENLRGDGRYVQSISTSTSEITVEGGAGSNFEVRLRGNGYDGPDGYATATCASRSDCETSPILVLCGDGVLVGSTGDFTTETGAAIRKTDSLRQSEALIGRNYDIFHDFLQARDWGRIAEGGFPYNDEVGSLLDEGRVLMLNWKNQGGPNAWADIAAGGEDDVIDRTAAELASFGEPMFLTFHHEPEDNIRDAAPDSRARQQELVDDYADAWRRIHDRFEAAGADNVIFVWNMTGFLARFEWMYEGGIYPGDDIIDWVSWNQYNWYGCQTNARWQTPAQTFGIFYDWLEEGGQNRPSLDKPLMLGEFSTEENDGAAGTDQTKGDWYRSIPDELANTFPRIKAVVLFDTEGRTTQGNVQFCEWSMHSSADALAGWADATSDPRWNRWFD